MKDKDEFPSPEEMQHWLERELVDAQKALELRVKDATTFVEAYARGDTSAEEAAQKTVQYSRRWGESLFGVGRSEGLSDDEILSRIDLARNKQRRVVKSPRSER